MLKFVFTSWFYWFFTIMMSAMAVCQTHNTIHGDPLRFVLISAMWLIVIGVAFAVLYLLRFARANGAQGSVLGLLAALSPPASLVVICVIGCALGWGAGDCVLTIGIGLPVVYMMLYLAPVVRLGPPIPQVGVPNPNA